MKRPNFKTVVICFGLFLFFLIIRFPYQNLRGFIFGKINKATGIVMGSQDLSITLLGWPGVVLTDVDVIVPAYVMGLAPGGDINLTAKHVTVRVGFSGIFPPRPSVSIKCSQLKKGGDLYINVSQSSKANYVNFWAEKVSLDAIPLGDPNSVASGKMSGEGDLVIDPNDFSKSTGSIELNIDKLKTPPFTADGYPYPSVSLGTLKSKISMKNDAIEIGAFQLGDPTSDLKGSISGDIRMAREFLDSKLNVALRLTSSPAFQSSGAGAAMRDALNGLDSRNRDRSWNLLFNKTLRETRTNLFLSIKLIDGTPGS